MNQKVAWEDDQKSLADGAPYADFENYGQQVDYEQKQIGKVKNAQPWFAFAFVLDLTVSGSKPFGEDEDEQVDCEGEVIHRTQYLQVFLHDGYRMINA